MFEQTVMKASEAYEELDLYLIENQVQKIFLVCDDSIRFLRINDYFKSVQKRLGVQVVRFNDFRPNPLYKSVVKGVELFCTEDCDLIIAVGGGSAMDVAKCIKLYSNMDKDENYLQQNIVPNDIELLAVPTTAGTGSEATRYAVIYYQGEKQSISDYSCIPSTVLLDASVLKTLPEYQRKSTMLDALCHSIESFWSVNSTDESKAFARDAICTIIKNKDAYLHNEEIGNANMLRAANTAGKAINLTQTTAGHAMCYKLISLYGIAHGHAAALCISKLFPYMVRNLKKCVDPRGAEYLQLSFCELAEAMGCNSVDQAVEKFDGILNSLGLDIPYPQAGDFEILRESVNSVRLKNNPVALDREAIDMLYHQILAKN